MSLRVPVGLYVQNVRESEGDERDDRAPKGRNEGTIMDWVRRHDEYASAAAS